jgi:hypothetical protein
MYCSTACYEVTREHPYFGRTKGTYHCCNNLQERASYHFNMFEGDTVFQDEQSDRNLFVCLFGCLV